MYSCDIVKPFFELNDLEGLKTANANLLRQVKVVYTRALGNEELLGAICVVFISIFMRDGQKVNNSHIYSVIYRLLWYAFLLFDTLVFIFCDLSILYFVPLSF